MGKLCRRCLGINDATPGILIDKAMDLMGETLVSEVSNKSNLFINIFSDLQNLYKAYSNLFRSVAYCFV